MIVYKCAECGREFTHKPLWPLSTDGKKAKRTTGLSEKAASDSEKHISPAKCYCSEKCRFEAHDNLRKAKDAKAYEKAKKAVNVSEKNYWKLKKLCIWGGFAGAHRWYAGKYFTALLLDFIVLYLILAVVLGMVSVEFIALVILDTALWIIDMKNIKRGRFLDRHKRPIWPEK